MEDPINAIEFGNPIYATEFQSGREANDTS